MPLLGEDGSGSDAERQRAEKAKRKAEKRASREKRKKRSAGGGGAPKEKKERKVKKTKLPGQPKRNQSAYFIWMNENREKIKRDHPGLSVTEFGKKAGALWKDLTDKSVRRRVRKTSTWLKLGINFSRN